MPCKRGGSGSHGELWHPLVLHCTQARLAGKNHFPPKGLDNCSHAVPGFLANTDPRGWSSCFPNQLLRRPLRRQRLLRHRNLYRCQPEGGPAALWFYPGGTIKDLDVAFGQATSRSQWCAGNHRWDDTGKYCTAGGKWQGFYPVGVSIRHPLLSLTGNLGVLRNDVSLRTKPSSLQRCFLFPGFLGLLLSAERLSCRELAWALAAEKALPGKALSAWEGSLEAVWRSLWTTPFSITVGVFLANVCCCTEHPELCSLCRCWNWCVIP